MVPKISQWFRKFGMVPKIRDGLDLKTFRCNDILLTLEVKGELGFGDITQKKIPPLESLVAETKKKKKSGKEHLCHKDI